MERDYVSRRSNLAARRNDRVQHPVNVRVAYFNHAYEPQPHFHDFPQIWYCRSGHYVHRTFSGDHSCTTGSLVIVPPGRPDSIMIPEGEKVYLICLELTPSFFDGCSFEILPRTLSQLFLPLFSEPYSSRDCFELSACSCGRAEAWLQNLRNLSDMDITEVRADVCSLLELLFSLPELGSAEEADSSVITSRVIPMLQALAFINANYHRKIYLGELTRITAMCQTNFMTCFKHFTGISFSVYLQLLRYSHARRLIGSTDYPLSYIADICGYTDVAYMINSFKKICGRTPRYTPKR